MLGQRVRSSLFAIGWLFALHALADVVVGIYRCHDMDRAVTDILAAALMRVQVCLLTIWLVLGAGRFSWRVGAWIGGVCFLFIVFSQFVFPGGPNLAQGAHWLDEEWVWYFRLSGPGDLLAKIPVLALGVAGPLIAWRAGRAIRRWRRFGFDRAILLDRSRLQFRLQDVAVWIIALSVPLAAIYRTAPYPSWNAELIEHWRGVYRYNSAQDVYSVLSAGLYVLGSLASLGIVYGNTKLPLGFRLLSGVAVAMLPAFGCQFWLIHITERAAPHAPTVAWAASSNEVAISAVAALLAIGSLWLVKAYDPPSNRLDARVGQI